jgi:hypothetical protein
VTERAAPFPAALRLPDDGLLRKPSAGSPAGALKPRINMLAVKIKTTRAIHSKKHFAAKFLRKMGTVNTWGLFLKFQA